MFRDNLLNQIGYIAIPRPRMICKYVCIDDQRYIRDNSLFILFNLTSNGSESFIHDRAPALSFANRFSSSFVGFLSIMRLPLSGREYDGNLSLNSRVFHGAGIISFSKDMPCTADINSASRRPCHITKPIHTSYPSALIPVCGLQPVGAPEFIWGRGA